GDPNALVSPPTSTHSEYSGLSASTARCPRAASSAMTDDLPVPDIPVIRMRFTRSSLDSLVPTQAMPSPQQGVYTPRQYHMRCIRNVRASGTHHAHRRLVDLGVAPT